VPLFRTFRNGLSSHDLFGPVKRSLRRHRPITGGSGVSEAPKSATGSPGMATAKAEAGSGQRSAIAGTRVRGPRAQFLGRRRQLVRLAAGRRRLRCASKYPELESRDLHGLSSADRICRHTDLLLALNQFAFGHLGRARASLWLRPDERPQNCFSSPVDGATGLPVADISLLTNFASRGRRLAESGCTLPLTLEVLRVVQIERRTGEP
jgi:hypothetical protein